MVLRMYLTRAISPPRKVILLTHKVTGNPERTPLTSTPTTARTPILPRARNRAGRTSWMPCKLKPEPSPKGPVVVRRHSFLATRSASDNLVIGTYSRTSTLRDDGHGCEPRQKAYLTYAYLSTMHFIVVSKSQSGETPRFCHTAGLATGQQSTCATTFRGLALQRRLRRTLRFRTTRSQRTVSKDSRGCAGRTKKALLGPSGAQ